ncbi:LuxR C-terminal-related transcriptional regulator [Microbacterium sp.]|uniref:helix-turn-helix transcriptional regulator n=1 Tax=Microbacterium sp. TaxID=51671 RepID=UPI0039E48425
MLATVEDPVIVVVDRAELAVGTALAVDLNRLLNSESAVRVVLSARPADDDGCILEQHPRLPDDALLFDLDEIEELADAADLQLSRSDAQELLHLTRGWPLAVRAELDARARPDDDAPSPHLARALAPLRALPVYPELLSLSIGDVIEPAIARHQGFSAQTLDTIESFTAQGLAWWLDNERSALQLQPALRTMLREELNAAPADQRRLALRLLADRHSLSGDHGSAFLAAADAADWDRAARFYRRRLLQVTDRSAQIARRLQTIPAIIRRRHPILQLGHALSLYSEGQRVRALAAFSALLGAAESRRLTESRPVSADDLWIQGAVVLALRLIGRYDLALTAVRRFVAMLGRVEDERDEIEEAMSHFLSYGALTHLDVDDPDAALALLDEAGIEVLPDRPAIERARVFGMRALVAAWRGDGPAASRDLEAAWSLELPEDFERSYTAITLLMAKAQVLLDHGEAREARTVLSLAEPHLPTTEHWAHLLILHVHATWQSSGAAAALAALDDGERRHQRSFPESPALSSALIALRIDLLIALGRHEAASDALASSPHRRSRAITASRARLLLTTGETQRAASLVTSALEHARSPRQRLALSAIAAACALRRGDREAAGELWRVSTEIAREHGLLTGLAGIPHRDLSELLAGDPELLRLLEGLELFPLDSAHGILLTNRERRVLAELAHGRSSADAAKALSVSENTVKTQIRSIYRKLGVRSRREAIEAARHLRLL